MANQLPLKLAGTPVVPTQFVAGTDAVGPTTGGTGLVAFANQNILVSTAANVWGNLALGANGTFLGVVAGAVTYSTIPPQSGIAALLVAGQNLVIGQPVFQNTTANTVLLAKANNNQTTGAVIGLVEDSTIANTASGNIAMAGILTATAAQWNTVTIGQPGGLSPGNVYYCSGATAGNIANGAPDVTAAGNFAVLVGEAHAATSMQLGTFQMFGY